MAEMKPETKIERLVTKMKPLADWYEKNKPDCGVIRILPDELKLLSDNPGPALQQGFFVRGEVITWRKFEVRSA